jgi:hypothetical protein
MVAQNMQFPALKLFSYGVLMVVSIKVLVLWIVRPYSLVDGWQHFGTTGSVIYDSISVKIVVPILQTTFPDIPEDWKLDTSYA